jgi:hypothetical protein
MQHCLTDIDYEWKRDCVLSVQSRNKVLKTQNEVTRIVKT